MTAPFGRFRKICGNQYIGEYLGAKPAKTACSSSSARLCRIIKRCVFPWCNMSAETLPSRMAALNKPPTGTDDNVRNVLAIGLHKIAV
jgi:hypothetical protein